jgi:two-component system, OmpR family, phosphate regulon sensor histidine kinase PhoR
MGSGKPIEAQHIWTRQQTRAMKGIMTTLLLSSFRDWISALPDAALLIDAAGTIRAANAMARKTFAAPLEGEPLALFIRSPNVAKALAEAFTSEDPVEAEYEEHGKVSRTMLVHLARLSATTSQHLVLLILRDRTREAQIEKVRSDFVANASHELRTPLTTLYGFIETMQGAARQDEKARDEFLKVMKAQAERMSLLIDDLLSLSRIEVDEHVEPQERIDFGVVLRQAESLLRPLASETGCELHFDVVAGVFVRGDANQLGQVAHNLIENAIKYSGKGKRVNVAVSRSGADAVLTITDNGPGIAARHIPRLTERFYRVNVQDSRTRGGTGLGLAICKHIINRHRGRLDITSEVGRGSTFQVVLPMHH